MSALDPIPTVTLATLQVEYSDGSAVKVVIPQAQACALETLPSGMEIGKDAWHDAALFAAPGGRAEREIIGSLPIDVVIRLSKIKGWRLAIKEADEQWRDDTREWLANGTR